MRFHMLIKNILCSTILFVSLVSYSKIIFISKNGNDQPNGKSWVNSFQTIQKGLEVASDNDQLWIAEGSYLETQELKVPEGISLYCGFSGLEKELEERNPGKNKVIIDGQKKHRCFLNEGKVDGISIYNGHSLEHGGGILNKGTLVNCDISQNYSEKNGGGVYNRSGKLEHCRIFNNKALAGEEIYNDGLIINCEIFQNQSDSIRSAVYNKGEMEYCKIYNNESKGCIWNYGVLNAVKIYDNIASDYVIENEHDGVILNSLIYHNHSTGKYTIKNSGGIAGCTIYDNDSECSSDYYNYGDGKILSSIVWKSNVCNRRYQNSCVTLPFSYMQDGNISSDPLFISKDQDKLNLGFRLNSNSPCYVDNPEGLIPEFWGVELSTKKT